VNIRESHSRESTNSKNEHNNKYQGIYDEGVGTGELNDLSKFTEEMRDF
jgi:hypothetical protein